MVTYNSASAAHFESADMAARTALHLAARQFEGYPISFEVLQTANGFCVMFFVYAGNDKVWMGYLASVV